MQTYGKRAPPKSQILFYQHGGGGNLITFQMFTPFPIEIFTPLKQIWQNYFISNSILSKHKTGKEILIQKISKFIDPAAF